MHKKIALVVTFLFFLLILAACSHQRTSAITDIALNPCQVVYDAGSSRTRLYIYEATKDGWLRHTGPKTGALADPVREIRGSTMLDAPEVVGNLIKSLDDMRMDGPVDGDGAPEWQAFDWRARCNIEAAAVYGTAGMRLAEQLNPQASEQVWGMLQHELGEYLGKGVTVRTLSGFEEGLFAWLAISEGMEDERFGIIEMGGVSVQVTFPCTDCDNARPVMVNGKVVKVFSHSFMGLGQDEAWKEVGSPPACARGVGLKEPGWQVGECLLAMPGTPQAVLATRDRVLNLSGFDWYLTGAFRYMGDADVDRYCRKGMDSGYQQESSCFRAVYLEHTLERLGVPLEAQAVDADWTLGAVICTATHCLE